MMSKGREADETGDIDAVEMERMWKKALSYGFQNRFIDYSDVKDKKTM